MNIKIADVNILFKGFDPVLNCILKEFSLLPKTKNEPDIIFEFVDFDIFPESQSMKMGNIYVGNNSIFVEGFINYKICGDLYSGEVTHILLKTKVKDKVLLRQIREKVRRFLNWNYLSIVEFLAKDFIYNIFDYCVYLKLLFKGSAFIHASSVEKDGKGVLFLAGGGVGKTTIMTNLVLECGYNFLSDDLSIIDTNFIYLNPKKLQIYPYNVFNNKELYRRLMKDRGLIDKFNWYYRKWKYGAKGVRRRMSPSSLFGQKRMALKAPLSKIIFLQRIVDHESRVEMISPGDLAQKCANIIIPELDPLARYIYFIRSTFKANSVLPDIEFLLQKSKEIYESIFSNKQCFLVLVGNNFSVDILFDLKLL